MPMQGILNAVEHLKAKGVPVPLRVARDIKWAIMLRAKAAALHASRKRRQQNADDLDEARASRRLMCLPRRVLHPGPQPSLGYSSLKISLPLLPSSSCRIFFTPSSLALCFPSHVRSPPPAHM